VSEMLEGAFKKLHHQHVFKKQENKTFMTDIFVFEAPLGIFGKLFSKFFLKEYMKGFLVLRNRTIKEIAEGNDWQQLVK
jgi:ligand-binding SRPBCC domain-containing protein